MSVLPVSKAQQKATSKYLKNTYDDIKVRVPKGEKQLIKDRAASLGKTMNEYIAELIVKDMGNGSGV